VNDLDRQIFHWINHWPDSLSPVLVFFSKGLDSPWMKALMIITFIALVSRPTTRRCGLVAGLMWPIANGLTDLAKKVPFGRPGNELPDAIIRVGMSPSMGTASAHSANMAFVAFAMIYYFPRWGWIWGLVALLTGFSRIYVAAHYPSQVVFGWTIGVLAAWLTISLIERRWPRQPQIESPEPELA
jgi:undecaprenyl-diphosphatase